MFLKMQKKKTLLWYLEDIHKVQLYWTKHTAEDKQPKISLLLLTQQKHSKKIALQLPV